MREDKQHPANKPQQVHECLDCGRTAVLTIFRNEGLCNNCRISRDVETVKRVADQQAHLRGELVEQRAFSRNRLKVEDIDIEEIVPKEEVVWCVRCLRHVVAEQHQECPHCQSR